MEEKLYTVVEASARSGKSTATIYTMLRAGELKGKLVKKGNRMVNMLNKNDIEVLKKQ